MSRHYALLDSEKFNGEVVVEIGSGTGIVGLTLLKYTQVAHVVFTDYTEEILALIRENIELQGSLQGQSTVELVDFN